MQNYILLYGIVGVLITMYFDRAIKSNPDELVPLSTLELITSCILWPVVVCIWVYSFFKSHNDDNYSL